ncbi:Protein O-mannosyl-transferase TMTC4 [Frankliniella fusca]|uniref:dolichyl-phosphate-mannose--protein mannosyltransferase n=1 Tax=Frankliniella fusca TaxID=407009 RepID=A0AAE1HUY9_9NEOP|nr:Protein O-mannosyl-transferase TMTC4 [Frankliniella fusca]
MQLKTTGLHDWDSVFPIPATSYRMSSVIVFLVGVLVFSNTVNGNFVFDDTEAIVNNRDVQPDSPLATIIWNDFWGTPLTHDRSHKSFRPVTILTFRWNVWLAGGVHPFSFHICNILLHGIVSALTVPVTNNLFGGNAPRMSLLTSLLFAVHPVHTEAVAGVVGRADLLCAFFSLLSLLAYVKAVKKASVSIKLSINYLLCSICLCSLALFSKEQGITILGICLAYDVIAFHRVNIFHFPSLVLKLFYCSHPENLTAKYQAAPLGQSKTCCRRRKESFNLFSKPFIIRSLSLLTAGLFLLYTRWLAMGSKPPIFQKVDNPASFAQDFWTRVRTYNYLYSLNAWLLVCPEWLSFDWSMGCVSLLSDLFDPRLLAIVVLWATLCGLIWRGNCYSNDKLGRTLNLSLAVLIIPFLPASNLFFRVGFVLAERVLYLPSLGFCMLVVLGMQVVLNNKPQYKKIIMITYACVLVIFCARSINRSNEWLEEYTLFRSALAVCPSNAKVHYNVAKNAGDMGNHRLATKEYEKALKLHPEYDQAMNNLANILRDEGKLLEAESLLRKAVKIRPDFAAAWMNLGIVLAALKQHDEAKISYTTALLHRSHYPECLYNLGNLYLDLKNTSEALKMFQKAVQQRPTFSIAWNNMVIMLESIGNLNEAKTVALEALKFLPNDAGLHFNLANTLGKMSNFEDAEFFFKRAVNLAPKNAIYHSNLGVLYHRWKKYDLAEAKYNDALSLDPKLNSAINNLEMLKKSKRKAVKWKVL